MRRQLLALAGLLALCLLPVHSAAQAAPPVSERGGTPPSWIGKNVLVLLLDDVGVDQLGIYGLGSDLPATPNIDRLARQGVRFENVWSNPVCSPTRATLLTGRYVFRNGVGHTVPFGGYPLDLNEITIPELLDSAGGGLYSHAAFGKWHLGDSTVGGALAPNLAGFDHYAGILNNVDNYYIYPKTENGLTMWSLGYQTSDMVDDFLRWERHQDDPWMAYMAFNAPHYPWTAPPAQLHTVDLSSAGPPGLDPRPYYKAMIEAVDQEIGRLLANMTASFEDTTVIFLADNGTPPEVVVPPFDNQKAKATLYEGGVRVPMVVAGAAVNQPGRVVRALVNTSDLFVTIADLAGASLPASWPQGYTVDSTSILPYLLDPSAQAQREYAFAEIFQPGGFGPFALEAHTVRDERYKLINSSLNPHPIYGNRLYDLWADPFETNNLLGQQLTPAQRAALKRLRRELAEILSS